MKEIKSLKPNQIFVFGSNTEGLHGSGAARTALDRFGAVYGQAEGLQGQSYAIVTKDLSKGFRSISLMDIEFSIIKFLSFAKRNSNKEFVVTPIGCGLGGFEVAEIKELFSGKKIPKNVILPKEFVDD